MWSCQRTGVLVFVWAAVMSRGLALDISFRRVMHGAELTWEGDPVMYTSWVKCSAMCIRARCNLWSWAPAEGWCSLHSSFTPTSITYTPNPSVHTYVTLFPPYTDYTVLLGEDMTWQNATQVCSSVGAVLAYPSDLQWLKKIKKSFNLGGLFLGLSKNSLSDKYWRDESGKPFPDSAISWAKREPSQNAEALCTTLHANVKSCKCDKITTDSPFCKFQFD
ncbi:uncharacterized protein LOC122256711 [Penaeus japonicus]|uniref:uncharacterized protein LOC122256711 n=1 Tax=Penaeus japonicus TaxID=27405 RepID=UPI001C7161B6|nr:uncharacterized protein LOC122256711 [Penaeus japonicus]